MKLANSEAYNYRDVLGLEPINQWTAEQETIHKNLNRMLQPGFTVRPADDIIRDAKLVGVKFLAEICCPSVEATLTLHLAKDMSIKYKVDVEEMGDACHKAYNALENFDLNMVSNLNNSINKKLNEIDPNVIKEGVKLRFEKSKIASPTSEQVEAALRIEMDLKRKNITYKEVSSYIENKRELLKEQGFEDKTLFNKGQNQDFSIMGAAGSGKSTISKDLLAGKDLTDQIMFNPDNYRVVTLPHALKSNVSIEKNRVTETQDIAYLTKKLVEDELKHISKTNQRPNIIFDGITLQDPIKSLILQGKLVSAVAAFAPSGYSQIAERAEARALDQHAAPSDKGRFLNTTSLLEGHAKVSENLLISVPQNVDTVIYSTNVERGSAATVMGVIKAPEKILEIIDLKSTAEFFNKTRINPQAVNPVSLIYNSKNSTSSDLSALNQSTHPENKAKAIIDLVNGNKSTPSYTIKLKEGDITYATLSKDESGKVIIKIDDKEIFDQKISSNNIESGILKAVTRQVIIGIDASLANSMENESSFQRRVSNYVELSSSQDKTSKVHPNLMVHIEKKDTKVSQMRKVLEEFQITTSRFSTTTPSSISHIVATAKGSMAA